MAFKPARPDMNTPLWRNWKTGLDTLVSVATVVTLIIAVVEYYGAREDARIQAALGYVQRFHSSPILESVSDLAEAYSGPDAESLYSSAQQNDLTGWAAKSLEFNKTKKLERQVEIVANYFDDLYFCVAHNLCNLKMTVPVVATQAQTVYVMSKSLLEELNKKTNGAEGCGLAALANMMNSAGTNVGDATQLNKSACPTS
jgi:hypothetical protein